MSCDWSPHRCKSKRLVGIKIRTKRRWLLRRRQSFRAKRARANRTSRSECCLLPGEQFANAGFAQRQQSRQLTLSEGSFLTRALKFNELPRSIHHKVEIHGGGHILSV